MHFLLDLQNNNSSSWFDENRSRYEDYLKEPAMQFIGAIGPSQSQKKKAEGMGSGNNRPLLSSRVESRGRSWRSQAPARTTPCSAKRSLERGNPDVSDRHRNESETPGGVLFVFFQEKHPYSWLFWFPRMASGADSGNFIGCQIQK